MSDELLIGLAGGAIGALLTGLFAQAARAVAAWGEVTLHDGETKERNAQLLVWVDDRTRELLIDLTRATNEMAGKGQLYSGAHGSALLSAKAKALHDYRDQQWQARLDLAQLRAREGAWHWLWRKARRSPALAITTETLSNVEPFLERWREPISRHGLTGAPLDRTTRTTADALAELPGLNLA